MTLIKSAGLLLFSLVLSTLGMVTARAQVPATSANQFLNTMGVCTHIKLGKDDISDVETSLQFLGLRNIRDDGTINSTVIDDWEQLHTDLGTKICALSINGDISDSISMYEQLKAAGALLAVEGPNEPNNFSMSYEGQNTFGTTLTTTTAAVVNASAAWVTSPGTPNTNAGHSYGPLDFVYGSGTHFVSSEVIGGLRNNYTGWVGMKFTVGSTAITVSQLGRWVVGHGTTTHTVKVVLASNGTTVASTTVDASTGTADTFHYGTVSPAVVLSANTAYYLVSSESSGGDSWYDAAYNEWPVAQFQKDLYQAVTTDANLAGIKVYASSLAGGSEPLNYGLQYLTIPSGAGTLMPDLTVYADYANCHNYLSGKMNELSNVVANTAWNAEDPTLRSSWDGLYIEYGLTWSGTFTGYSTSTVTSPNLPSLPRVTTETGWWTSGATNAITEDQQGKLLLNLYFDAVKRNWAQTFVFMLHDDTSAGEGCYGYYHTDWTKKTSAIDIHNLTTILSDSGTFTPGSLNYSIPSEPSTVHDLLLQKSDGTFEIAVWDEEPPPVSPATQATDTVTVNLGAQYGAVNIYDPTSTTNTTTPIQTLGNVSSVTLTLSDHPQIIEIPPQAGVFVNDQFNDGGLTDGTDPLDVAWTVQYGSPTLSVGSYGTTGNSTNALIYTSASGYGGARGGMFGPRTLADGESLVYTQNFRVTSTTIASDSGGLRFGIGNSALTYGFLAGTGTTTGGSINLFGPNAVGGTNSGLGTTGTLSAINDNNSHTFTMTVARSGASLNFNVNIDNIHTYTATTGSVTNFTFDRIMVGEGNVTNLNFNLDNVNVTVGAYTPLVQDGFNDGGVSDGTDPLDTSWSLLYGGPATLSVGPFASTGNTSNAMLVAPSNVYAVVRGGTFPSAALNVGDSVVLTQDFRIYSGLSSNSSGFRIALGSGNNTYAFLFGTGTTTGAGFSVYPVDAITSTSTPLTTTGTPIAINDNNPHTFALTLTRVDATTLSLTACIDNVNTYTATTTGVPNFTFNRIVMGEGNVYYSYALDNVNVSILTAP